MKLLTKIIFVIVVAIAIYASFLIISDINSIYNEFSNFQFEYLPIILILLISAFFTLIFRWHLLLKKSGINIPRNSSVMIFMSGVSLSMIPGRAGELIKSELLKIKFDVPRSKSVSIVIVEQIYTAIGLLITSFFGLYYFDLSIYIIIVFSIILTLVFLFLSSEKFYQKCIKFIIKIKFLNRFVENIFVGYNRRYYKTSIELKKLADVEIFAKVEADPSLKTLLAAIEVGSKLNATVVIGNVIDPAMIDNVPKAL